jgi:hypothetical protein
VLYVDILWPDAILQISTTGGNRMAITAKRTLTLVLNDAEMEVLDALSSKRSLSKVALIRQALRLYQTVEVRQERGEKLFFENERSKEKAELMIL